VIDVRKLDACSTMTASIRAPVVAEPELGLGPLHTAFDGKGNAYTTLFLDSQVVKWNIEKAVRAYAGEDVDPIISKTDVHYQPGHNSTTMGETLDADGKWLHLDEQVLEGPLPQRRPAEARERAAVRHRRRQDDLVHDGPTFAEPHDSILVHRSKVNPLSRLEPQRPDVGRDPGAGRGRRRDIDDWMDTVIRDGNKVRVYMSSQAPNFSLESFTVKEGDEVTVIVTNLDDIEDLTHGFCMGDHGIALEVRTAADVLGHLRGGQAGVYWYYCQWFCHALHMEMRGRMFVEPKGA
jgi:nitrous-oxide reductase